MASNLYWYILVMLIILTRYLSSLMTALRYFQEMWSSSEVNKLLYLIIALLNFSLEKDDYTKSDFDRISSKILGFILWLKHFNC